GHPSGEVGGDTPKGTRSFGSPELFGTLAMSWSVASSRVRSPMCIVGCGQRSCVWQGASHVTIWPRCTRCTRGGGVTSYGWCRSHVGCRRTLSVERAVLARLRREQRWGHGVGEGAA